MRASSAVHNVVLPVGMTRRPPAGDLENDVRSVATMRLPPLASWPGPLLFLAVGVVYAALAQYVFWLNDPLNNGAGFWPAAGVTLAACVVVPIRRWPWILAAVALAEGAVDLAHGYPVSSVVWWVAGNTAEPAAGAALIHRFAPGGRLVPVRNLVVFFAAAAVGAVVAAVVGSGATTAVIGREWVEIVVKWAVGDALGTLAVAPLLLAGRQPPTPARSTAESVAFAGVVGGIAFMLLQDWPPEVDITLPLLVIPVLAVVGLRFGVRVAAAAGFVVAHVANVANGLGHGPFEHLSGETVHAITVLQAFVALALTVGLLVAVLVADAIERARVSERHQGVADALQRAVLPARLPSVPGLELAARYVPAPLGSATMVGGDWYDAFLLADGTVCLAVGDVMGHGIQAAVVMAQVRNGLRSLAFEIDDPAEVLAVLDRQLARDHDDVFATAIFARYRDGELWWANAGHPPLFVIRRGGSVEMPAHSPFPLLGLGTTAYGAERVALEPGDAVVVYTDGLVEQRDRPLGDGLDRLLDIARRLGPDAPDALCDSFLLEAITGRARTDDVCVLAARRAAPATVPTEPAVVVAAFDGDELTAGIVEEGNGRDPSPTSPTR